MTPGGRRKGRGACRSGSRPQPWTPATFAGCGRGRPARLDRSECALTASIPCGTLGLPAVWNSFLGSANAMRASSRKAASADTRDRSRRYSISHSTRVAKTGRWSRPEGSVGRRLRVHAAVCGRGVQLRAGQILGDEQPLAGVHRGRPRMSDDDSNWRPGEVRNLSILSRGQRAAHEQDRRRRRSGTAGTATGTAIFGYRPCQGDSKNAHFQTVLSSNVLAGTAGTAISPL
ncbi:hypothetical protein PX52LOC_06266 [Limnoglobus roseus]|uniref:Uncharacterized protein n=1 Tax=Limnoglobus roseus TaxID=2598579 RepID=A0A5C1AMK8_9BACT|nr:hypothetical protein PX52LOC_06266 [Limnoglobus roseus]